MTITKFLVLQSMAKQKSRRLVDCHGGSKMKICCLSSARQMTDRRWRFRLLHYRTSTALPYHIWLVRLLVAHLAHLLSDVCCTSHIFVLISSLLKHWVPNFSSVWNVQQNRYPFKEYKSTLWQVCNISFWFWFCWEHRRNCKINGGNRLLSQLVTRPLNHSCYSQNKINEQESNQLCSYNNFNKKYVHDAARIASSRSTGAQTNMKSYQLNPLTIRGLGLFIMRHEATIRSSQSVQE